ADLQKILSTQYDRERWLDTLRQVLPSAAVYLSAQTVPARIANTRRVVQLGEVGLADQRNLALLEVEAAATVDLARNRAGLRAVAARFIDVGHYQGVLAIFHKPERDDWRLTLAARSATFEESSQEFAIRETSPRRYTYLLGPNETCRTAAE